MNIKNIAIGGLVVIALLCGFYLGRSGVASFGAINPTGPQHQQMEAFLQGAAFGTRNQTYFDNAGNYVMNSVTDIQYRASSMTQATTTPCAIGPVTATSTLESFVANVTIGTTTASVLTLATSTSPNATTSVIAQKNVAAGAQVTFDWHPATNNSVVSPGTYIVLGQQGNPGTFSNTGTCNARIRSVN